MDVCQKLVIIVYKVVTMNIFLTKTHHFTSEDEWMHFFGLQNVGYHLLPLSSSEGPGYFFNITLIVFV